MDHVMKLSEAFQMVGNKPGGSKDVETDRSGNKSTGQSNGQKKISETTKIASAVRKKHLSALIPRQSKRVSDTTSVTAHNL